MKGLDDRTRSPPLSPLTPLPSPLLLISRIIVCYTTLSVVSRRKSNNPGARGERDELGAPDGVRNRITRSVEGISQTVQAQGLKEEGLNSTKGRQAIYEERGRGSLQTFPAPAPASHHLGIEWERPEAEVRSLVPTSMLMQLRWKRGRVHRPLEPSPAPRKQSQTLHCSPLSYLSVQISNDDLTLFRLALPRA